MEFSDTLHVLVGQKGEDFTWWQMSIRAVVIFAFGVVLVRIASKRAFGRSGAIDIILSVIIGSNLSRALTGSAPFEETLIASAVLVALHALLAALAARVSWLGPLLKGKPSRLLKDGEVDMRALRRHAIGAQDFEEALRRNGLVKPEDAAEVWLERNGSISLVKRRG